MTKAKAVNIGELNRSACKGRFVVMELNDLGGCALHDQEFDFAVDAFHKAKDTMARAMIDGKRTGFGCGLNAVLVKEVIGTRWIEKACVTQETIGELEEEGL